MISCLTVTRPGRLSALHRSILCFEHQTHSDRELVIVHDGDAEFDGELNRRVSEVESATRVVRSEPGRSLGWLRNVSIDSASGDVVCQWDDDDLYHPRRLEAQYLAMTSRDAAASFLVDQLHLFEPTGDLYWDDWVSELFPGSLIQGTLMARKGTLVPYPDLPRGEDTPLVQALAAAGHRLASLQDHGYLYVYVFDGHNAWDEGHHRSISQQKARSGPHLAMGIDELRLRLVEYPVPPRRVLLVDGERRVELTLGGA